MKSCPQGPAPTAAASNPTAGLNRAVGAANKASWHHALQSWWLENINHEQAELGVEMQAG